MVVEQVNAVLQVVPLQRQVKYEGNHCLFNHGACTRSANAATSSSTRRSFPRDERTENREQRTEPCHVMSCHATRCHDAMVGFRRGSAMSWMDARESSLRRQVINHGSTIRQRLQWLLDGSSMAPRWLQGQPDQARPGRGRSSRTNF